MHNTGLQLEADLILMLMKCQEKKCIMEPASIAAIFKRVFFFFDIIEILKNFHWSVSLKFEEERKKRQISKDEGEEEK